MKILIVRHADPDYSIDSLTPVGWKEAELLSHRLKKLDVKAFYMSPRGRAMDTASLTLKAMGREAEICQWMREFDVHITKPYDDRPNIMWDWLPEVWTNEPLFYREPEWLDAEFLAPYKEELVQELNWVYQGFDDLLARHGYVRDGRLYRAVEPNEDTIVLFCHFGLECVLLSHLLGVSPMVLWHGTCALPSSVTTVVSEERREGIASFRINGFGDISHLYAADQEPSFSARFCETFENRTQRHD